MNSTNLFDLYAFNFSRSTGLKGNLFACPICHRIFAKNQIDFLHEEHIIPKSLGGGIIGLTCKDCNNNYGSKYISKLKHNFKTVDDISSEPIDMRMSSENQSIAIDINKSSSIINVISDRSNPKSVEYFRNLFLDNPNMEYRFNLSTKYYHEKYEKMAILLISYLLIFHYLGYSYALNHWGLEARDVIINNNFHSRLLFNIFRNSIPRMNSQTTVKIIYCTDPPLITDMIFLQYEFPGKNAHVKYQAFIPCNPGIKPEEEFWNFDEKWITLKGNIVSYNKDTLLNPYKLQNVKTKAC